MRAHLYSQPFSLCTIPHKILDFFILYTYLWTGFVICIVLFTWLVQSTFVELPTSVRVVFVPDHAEHGEPDVGHVLRREPAVPNAQHVGHGLKNGIHVIAQFDQYNSKV